MSEIFRLLRSRAFWTGFIQVLMVGVVVFGTLLLVDLFLLGSIP